jgi:hypothetical protein
MVTSRPALTDPPGLVALLYRADWTRLCLSADVAARAETTHVTRTDDGRVIRWQADQEDPSPNRRDGHEINAAKDIAVFPFGVHAVPPSHA